MRENKEISESFLLMSDGRGLTVFTAEGRRIRPENGIRTGEGVVLNAAGFGQLRARSVTGGALTFDPSTGVLARWH